MKNLHEQIQEALHCFQQNRLTEAVTGFEHALAGDPRNPVALHFLGLCLHQQGNSVRGVQLLREAIQHDPARAMFYSNLGRVLAELNQIESAIAAYQEAAGLGLNSPELYNNLGAACADLGRWDDAINAFGKAAQLLPNSPQILVNLGKALLETNRLSESIDAFSCAVQLRPDAAEALNGWARALQESGRADEALKKFRESLRIRPRNAKTHLAFGNLLLREGQTEEAIHCLGKALELAPDYFPAKWAAHLALPVIYRSADEIARFRARWSEGIRSLDRDPMLFVGSPRIPTTNFYLHYQGHNDLEEQRIYARVVTRIAAAQCPERSRPTAHHRHASGRKIKVGFASCYFSLHTVFKLFHGWIRHLDRARFEVHTFHLGSTRDKATDFVEQHSDSFAWTPFAPRQIAETILRGNLDVLIYPEIGMDPLTQMLATHRLAPVQCMSWGHPITSGFSTIDYFLSSELMEGPGAEAHYAEKLIRLPNLSIYFPPPDTSLARDFPDVPDGTARTRYLCLQSLFKLLPQHDQVFSRLAQQHPHCAIQFIAHESPRITTLFRERLEQAFVEHGLDPARHLCFFPKQNIGGFFGLIRASDVILDSLAWSGGNTTLEAIAFDKPVVTLPGEMMRSRHTAAILRRIGLEETIAADESDYLAKAVRLGLDDTWRDNLIQKIAANKSRAYNDHAAVDGLESFLVRLSE